MTEGEKYKLSLYRSSAVLRSTDTGKVELVECSLDDKKYIKKTYYSDKRVIFSKLRDVNSKNLPKIFEVFFSESTVVIEEFIEGETLESIIASGKKFRKNEVRKIAVSLCNAISHLHKLGIIHRDIKPANIILRNGEAVLIDFGIAREFSEKQNGDTEHFGTVGYAPPEQFGFSQSDERSDIYAFGVTLKQLGHFKKIASKCCEFDPNKRYQNVLEIKRGFKKRFWWIWVAALALVLGLCVGLYFIFKTPQDELDYARIVSGGVPALSLTEDREYRVALDLGEGVKAKIKAQKTENGLDITLGNKIFSFEDSGNLPKEPYPHDAELFCDIVFHDINLDGVCEIFPILGNGIVVSTAATDFMQLNYTIAWCLYFEDGEFKLAEGEMVNESGAFSISQHTPYAFWVDGINFYALDGDKIYYSDYGFEF